MLGFITNRWVLIAIAVIVFSGGSFWKGVQHGKKIVQTKWDAEKVVWQQEMQAEKDKAWAKERDLQAKADKNLKEKVGEYQTVSVRYHALLNSLRERPEARAESGVSEAADDGVGCTGEGLARPDAEFLAGYAADAARLQAAYNSCKQAYEAVTEDAK